MTCSIDVTERNFLLRFLFTAERKLRRESPSHVIDLDLRGFGELTLRSLRPFLLEVRPFPETDLRT